MYKLEDKILEEWNKIKDYNIFNDIEEFSKLFDEKPNGKCLRIITSDPWSKENFFFGTQKELFDYYKEKKIEEDWNKIKDSDIFESIDELRKLFEENPKGRCFRIYTSYPWSKDNFFFGEYKELLEIYKNKENNKEKVLFHLDSNIGKKFGTLTIKSFDVKENNIIATCECDCGVVVEKNWKDIQLKKDNTCGNHTEYTLMEAFPNTVRKYWDYEKNEESPENIYSYDTKEYWWKGANGSYLMPVNCLNLKQTGTSFPEQAILFYINKLGCDTLHRHKVKYLGKNYEVDIFLPEYNIAIEYDGTYWHKNKLSSDNAKNFAIDKLGMFLIRIRESGLKNTNIYNGIELINDIDNCNYMDGLVDCINNVLKIIFERTNKMTQITKEQLTNDRREILNQFYVGFEEDNIYNSWLSHHWSQNNVIDAYLVSEQSNDKFLFKCTCGHDILVSPKQLCNILIGCNDKDSSEFKEKLSFNNSCPFYNTPFCPSNKFYQIYNYKEECDFFESKQIAFNDLKNEFLKEISNNFKWTILLFYIRKFMVYKGASVSDILADYIELENYSDSEKFSNMHEIICFPNFMHEDIYKFFENKKVTRFYVDNYDYSRINNTKLYLNIEHEDNIFELLTSLIYMKKTSIFEDMVSCLKNKLDCEFFDNMMLNFFIQTYTRNTRRFDNLTDKNHTFDNIVDIIMSNVSESIQFEILKLLKEDRENVEIDIYTKYMIYLHNCNKLNYTNIQTIMHRLRGPFSIERTRVINEIVKNLKKQGIDIKRFTY